jgi:hypothetical protein
VTAHESRILGRTEPPAEHRRVEWVILGDVLWQLLDGEWIERPE